MTDLQKLRVQDYLEHMQEAVRLARSYATGMGKEDFIKDRRTQQAIVLNLITLGEVAARLMSEHSEFAEASPDPTREVSCARNGVLRFRQEGHFQEALSHGYQH